jgi:hypothetical protein
VDYKALLHEQQVKAEEAARKKRLQQKLATPKEMYFTTQIAGEGAWFLGCMATGGVGDAYRTRCRLLHGLLLAVLAWHACTAQERQATRDCWQAVASHHCACCCVPHAAADNDLQHKLGKILQFLEEGYR